MARNANQFQTIRSEGALLPPDVLQAIASQKVDGVSPASYHLPPGTKLNEAIAHSWSVLQKYWKGFQEIRCRLPDEETGTEATNQNWLLPLFEELKYGRLVTTKNRPRSTPVHILSSDSILRCRFISSVAISPWIDAPRVLGGRPRPARTR